MCNEQQKVNSHFNFPTYNSKVSSKMFASFWKQELTFSREETIPRKFDQYLKKAVKQKIPLSKFLYLARNERGTSGNNVNIMECWLVICFSWARFFCAQQDFGLTAFLK